MIGQKDSIVILLMPPAGFVMALTVAGLFSLSGWLPELVSHFYAQYLIALLLFVACFCIVRKWKFALLLVPFVIVCLAKIVPLYFGPVYAGDAGGQARLASGLSVMTINVNTNNRKIDAVLANIRQFKPDVICVQEVDKWWVEQLKKALLSEYSFCVTEPSNDNFGIAEFSKLPCRQHKIIWLGEPAVPAIWAEYLLEDKKISVISLHTLPPALPHYTWIRNGEFATLAKLRPQLGEHLIIAGDLNCTPFSQDFEKLLQATSTTNTMNGFGLQCTWPAFSPYYPLLLIPIDHVLTSPNIVCIERKVGAPMGSDHFPVFVRLKVAN